MARCHVAVSLTVAVAVAVGGVVGGPHDAWASPGANDGVAAVDPPVDDRPARAATRKGRFFAHYGFLWAAYNETTLEFSGPDYGLDLEGVSVRDMPELESAWDLVSTRAQYVLRVGYYLDDRYSVSLGIEHLKYQVLPQEVIARGGVGASAPERFRGVYDGSQISVGREGDLLEYFDHSDGLNLIDLEVLRTSTLWERDVVAVELMTGGALGPLIPHSDIRFLGSRDRDDYRLAGFAFAAVGGLRTLFFDVVFVDLRLKAGYLRLFNVQTIGRGSVAHENLFLSPTLSVGVLLPADLTRTD